MKLYLPAFIALFFIMTMVSCSDDDTGTSSDSDYNDDGSAGWTTADGDTVDGDSPDGDLIDGDTEDGDTTDGDATDGDMTDGDTADGDMIDGDIADGDYADGDAIYPDGDADMGEQAMDGDVTDGDLEDGDVVDGDETTDGDATDGDDTDGDEVTDGDDDPLALCPETDDPYILYLSSDDSNSVASPVIARDQISKGQIPDSKSVRMWEFLNYYKVDYPAATRDETIAVYADMAVTDEADRFTLQVAARSYDLTGRLGRPMNLTFILDTSGSMGGDPINRLKDVCLTVASRLNPGDIVSIVTWSTRQDIILENHAVTGPNDQVLTTAIHRITSGGGTDLHAGLQTGYELARRNFAEDKLNRVILISDGQANAGITDISIISEAADDSDGEGIYLVGVGVGNGYNDTLMDKVTDAGRGAYIFIDSTDEAQMMFGTRFLENMEVAARAVRMEVTLPWYMQMKEFHGEEYGENPLEIEPQHLAPNDAMVFHQEIAACGPDLFDSNDSIRVKVYFSDPETRQNQSVQRDYSIRELLQERRKRALKGDAVVRYAKAIMGDYQMTEERNRALHTLPQEFEQLFEDTLDTDYLEMSTTLLTMLDILE